jgi:hypothetical protein
MGTSIGHEGLPFRNRRLRRARKRSGELLTVGAVMDPVAGGGNPFPGRDRGGMADQGDQLALSTSLNPQDAYPREIIILLRYGASARQLAT